MTLDILQVVCVGYLLYTMVYSVVTKFDWRILLNTLPLGMNAWAFYIRHARTRRLCKTCGFYVLPPSEQPTLSGMRQAGIETGLCLKLNKEKGDWEWQIGSIHRQCWKNPKKVKDSPEIRMWNNYLETQRIEQRGW